MFSNLKTSDWVSAGLKGLSIVGTGLALEALNDKPTPPPEAELPSPDALDAAQRIWDMQDADVDVDFQKNLFGNIITGGRGLDTSASQPDDDPISSLFGLAGTISKMV